MSTVIDVLFWFICSFTLAYGVYTYMMNNVSSGDDEQESDMQRLKRRLNMLSMMQVIEHPVFQ